MVKPSFRLVQKAALLYLIALLFFGWGIAAARYEVFPWKFLHGTITEVRDYIEFAQADGALRERLLLDHQERFSQFDFSGLKKTDEDFTDNGYLLIAKYSKSLEQSVVELFSLAENKVLHTWVPQLEEIFEQTPLHNNMYNKQMAYRTLHPLLFPNGDLVFSSEEGPLVRIDACGRILWTIDRHFHHSKELDADGNILACIRMLPDPESYAVPDEREDYYKNDGYAVVSPDGKILEERSITDIFLENGHVGLLFGVGRFERDQIHLNDVQPILEDNGDAKVGDIAFSIRHLSTVALYRPSTGKLIWVKTGPWLNQHDVNPLGDGTYSIFGNDGIRNPENKGYVEILGPIESKIYVYDPQTDEISLPYAKMTKQVKLQSKTEGRARILENGDVFIEETNKCRLLRLSPEQVRWEYNASVTEETVGVVHWCRYLAADEVDLSWLENVNCN